MQRPPRSRGATTRLRCPHARERRLTEAAAGRRRVADGHSDLLFELAFRRGEENPFGRWWLPELESGGVCLQVCAVGADLDQPPEGALRSVLDQIAAAHRAVHENTGRVCLIRGARELGRVVAGERIGLLLAMEGAEPIGYDPQMLDVFWELGVRMISLTWNRRNLLADGVGETADGGLSQAGVRVLDRLATLGFVLDLAHASPRTFEQALEVRQGAPVLVSHGACREVHASPRNLTDDQLRRLAEHGGILCVMAHPLGVDPEKPTIDRLVDHIVHAADVIGLDRVGLGGDFIAQIAQSGAISSPLQPDAVVPAGFARDAALEHLRGPADYPNLIEALERRGFSAAEVEAVACANLLRFLQQQLPDGAGPGR